MISLKRMFLVPFDDPAISSGELRLFSEDHIGRLRRQNTTGAYAGRFTVMLAATEAVFARFVGSLNIRTSAGAAREGDTMAMNAALEAFQALVRRREGRVKDKFGKPSPQYEEFFPRGLTGYNEVTLETAETWMTHMVATSTKYQVQLGADMVAEFTGARTAFVDARGDQTEQSGSVAEAIRERKEARDAMAEQLMDNLYDIAKMFKRQPDRCADFFNESKLREDVPSEPEPPVPPAPAPGP